MRAAVRRESASRFGVFAPIDRDQNSQPFPGWWFREFWNPGVLESWQVLIPAGLRYCLRRVVVQSDYTDLMQVPHGDVFLEVIASGGRAFQNAPVSARASGCMVINAPNVVPVRDIAWVSGVWAAALSASTPLTGHTVNQHWQASEGFTVRLSFDPLVARPNYVWVLLMGYAVPEQSLRSWGERGAR